MIELELGRERGPAGRPDAATVRLPAKALLRHMMALGSSGSGKTVLSKIVVEEIAVPSIGLISIAQDPQGGTICLFQPQM